MSSQVLYRKWRPKSFIEVVGQDRVVMTLREGIKQFSNWPTIPQLYIKEEFIGGCDIVKEMYESGELLELLNSKEIETNPS